MKTWREIRESLANDPTFVRFVLKGNGQEESRNISQQTQDKKDNKDKNHFYSFLDKNTSKDKNDEKDKSSLEDRLTRHGISIAIDRATGSAFLVFTRSEVDAVRHVADVHKPLEVKLNASQTAELVKDIDYYETLLSRKRHSHTEE